MMQSTLSKSMRRSLIIWLLTGCFLIYLMVVIGGITRLTGSGMSITEWKPIKGTIPPMNAQEWQQEFEHYKQIPQFKIREEGFDVDDFKSIYWWEYIHRLLGRVIGMVFLIPFLWWLVRRKIPKQLMPKLLLLLFLGGMQGVLGWYMVSSGLVDLPYVSHYRLAAHLISAFIVFGFTLWTALGLIYEFQISNYELRKLKTFAWMVFAFVILQIIYGAFLAGLKGGYAYNTFPKMGNAWLPKEVFSQTPFWRNLLAWSPGVQFIHRILGYIVLVLVTWFYVKTRRQTLSILQQKISLSLLIIVLCQFTLGLCTLIFNVPITLAVLHQTGAFFLFSGCVVMINRL